MRKLFYIYLNGTAVNKHKGNYILKFQPSHRRLKHGFECIEFYTDVKKHDAASRINVNLFYNKQQNF